VRTGKRLLVQPAFFEKNLAALFTDSKRKWNIYFDYPGSEDDQVSIELPEGWELDQPVVPSPSVFKDVGAYNVAVAKTPDGRKIVYRRKFDWGRNMNIILPASAYDSLKKILDFVQQQDSFTVTLKAAADAH
jgi:hypothetical protein